MIVDSFNNLISTNDSFNIIVRTLQFLLVRAQKYFCFRAPGTLAMNATVKIIGVGLV